MRVAEYMEETAELLRAKEELEEFDDWVQRALADDMLVAQMLVIISRSATELTDVVASLPHLWRGRRPRSRQVDPAGIRKAQREANDGASAGGCGGYDLEDDRRTSPQSPLSWSGGSDDTQRRNKNWPAGPTASEKGKSKIDASERKQLKSAIGGRARKRKTRDELKEEENKLLLENADFRKRIKEMKFHYNQLYMKNLSLKEAMKVKSKSQSSSLLPMVFPHDPSSSSGRVMVEVLPESSFSEANAAAPHEVLVEVPTMTPSLKGAATGSSSDVGFRLPDLNLSPEPEQ